MFRSWLALAVACVSGAASAQLSPVDPDWQEVEAPRPGPVRTTGLIPLDVPGTTMRFGVDPASVSVGEDRVVRYVVVATSPSGVINAMYEGLRCNTAQVKVYARHNPDSGWVPAQRAEWQALHTTPNYRYSLLIARQGACVGHAANVNAARIVRDLRTGGEPRSVTN